MDIFQTLLITLVIFAVLVGGYMVLSMPSTGKAQKRRLEALRYRHSESTDTKVESQLKKAIAARKPKRHRVAGSGSRSEALAMRLDRTGKGWTVSQYIYASIGIALVIAVLIYIQSGALLLGLGVGAVVALGCTIGQGLSAFSVLAWSAPVTFAAIFAGAAFGLRQLIEGFQPAE